MCVCGLNSNPVTKKKKSVFKELWDPSFLCPRHSCQHILNLLKPCWKPETSLPPAAQQFEPAAAGGGGGVGFVCFFKDPSTFTSLQSTEPTAKTTNLQPRL